MKILFISNNLSRPGGIEKYSGDFIAALSESGENVIIAQFKKSSLFNKIFFSAEIILKSLYFRPDVIICGHINFSPVCLFMKRVFDFEYAVIIHGIEAWNINSKIKKIALENSKKVIVVSNYTAEAVVSGVPAVKDKLFLLPNSVDGGKIFIKEKPGFLVEKYGLAGKKIIFTLCRLSSSEKYKGYDRVIEALPLIKREISEIKYILAGEGDDKERIEKLISDLNLKETVILAGHIDEQAKIDYYNLCDVFAMPSKGEGFGIVFLEALACGKPVVAGGEDGSRDALLGGDLGIMVNPDNVKEVAEAITGILKNNVHRALLDADYLRKRTLEAYGADVFKKRVAELIKIL